jgi:hypothetical protein
MATVLLAWEFGGGYGHAARIVRLAEVLSAASHHVVVAARELPRVTEICECAEFTLLESPRVRSRNCVAVPRTFAHVLWNAGYGDEAKLHARSESWTKLLDSVNADLIVFDHAPTALLAARGRNVRRVVIGTGLRHISRRRRIGMGGPAAEWTGFRLCVTFHSPGAFGIIAGART